MPKTKALTDNQGALLRERVEIIAFMEGLDAIYVAKGQRRRDIEMMLIGAEVPLDTEPPPAPPEPPANRAEARRQERAEKRARVEADAAARKTAGAKKAPAKKATKRPAKKVAAKAGGGGAS